MTTWFIADLHLDNRRPESFQCFLQFVEHLKQSQADALYILGDFFEYWLGDDVLEHPLTQSYQPIIEALASLQSQSIPTYFQHGNRDFLIGERFAQQTGMTLLPEAYIADLYGTPTLLMHGDSLCTDDVEYQKIRPLLRSEAWQQDFLSKSIEERIQMAQAMREQSRESMKDKAEDILDVNQQTVETTMQAHRVTQLIHGHTHRPAIHQFEVAGQYYTRAVLGDWYQQGSFLPVTEQGIGKLSNVFS